jgi:hypothetical protein
LNLFIALAFIIEIGLPFTFSPFPVLLFYPAAQQLYRPQGFYRA